MPASNSILCEFLASHGYVVASLGMLGTHSSGAEISPKGLLTMATDVQVVIHKISTWPNVEVGKIALIGLGFNSSTCMTVQTLNPAIDAVISLDGGILSNFEDEMLKKLPQFEVSAINVPLLVIHSPHPYIDPATIDYYVHSDRYFLYFKQMSEFYFLNYGMFEPFVPRLLGEVPGDTKRGVEVAAKGSLVFLDGVFKNQKDIEQALQAIKGQENLDDDFLTISKKAGIPAPPNIALLQDLFLREGVNGLITIYNQLKKENPSPFTESFYSAFNDWLAWKKDPDYSARKALGQLRVESFPSSALAQYYLGYYGKRNGDATVAQKGYTAALELLSEDPTLDQETQARIEKNATTAIQELEAREILGKAKTWLERGKKMETIQSAEALATCKGPGPEDQFTTLIQSDAQNARFEQIFGTGHTIMGINPDQTWSYNPNNQQRQESLDTMTQLFVLGHELHWLCWFPETRFANPLFKGEKTFDGQQAFEMKWTDPLNRPVLMYYAVASHQPLGFEMYTSTLEKGETVSVYFNQWETQEGIQVFKGATFRQGEFVFEYDYTRIGLNQLTEEDFADSSKRL